MKVYAHTTSYCTSCNIPTIFPVTECNMTSKSGEQQTTKNSVQKSAHRSRMTVSHHCIKWKMDFSNQLPMTWYCNLYFGKCIMMSKLSCLIMVRLLIRKLLSIRHLSMRWRRIVCFLLLNKKDITQYSLISMIKMLKRGWGCICKFVWRSCLYWISTRASTLSKYLNTCGKWIKQTN